MSHRRWIAVPALLAIAACGHHGDQGTSVSLNMGDEDGKGSIVADGNTGQVAINTPFFEGKIKLPKIQLDADHVDLNGVKLYPGSKVTTFDVNGRAGRGDDGKGTVRIAFTAPADPGRVRDYYQSKLPGAGFHVTRSGDGLAGMNNEGKPFTLTLHPADGGSAGEIDMSGG